MLQIDLAAEIEQVIERKVAAGEYSSVTALVEEALFLLVERDWQAAQTDLRAQAGFLWNDPESGSSTEALS